MTRWVPGDTVIWRSRPQGAIGYVAPQVVVEDADVVALFQPAGTVCKKRGGRRGGPRGRCLVDWDGTHEDVVFGGPPNVKLHAPGSAHSVYRKWDSATESFGGWYVNLESPLTRTSLGFDTWDHILDVEVADDLEAWRLKDLDELEWSLERGLVSREQFAAIRSEAERVGGMIERRDWPFVDGWERWRPSSSWSVPTLPEGWDRT